MSILLESIARYLIDEAYSRDDYEKAAQEQQASRTQELDAIAAFMKKHKTKTNAATSLPSRGAPINRPAGGRVRSLAYGLQARLGIEFHPYEGPAFDSAVEDYSRFTNTGAVRRDPETDEPKPIPPEDIVAAWKEYFRYIPKASKWHGRL